MITNKGKTLYCVAYERGFTEADFLYFQAVNRLDAVNQVLRSPELKGARIVAIAPVIGVHYDEPQTSKDADNVQLYV